MKKCKICDLTHFWVFFLMRSTESSPMGMPPEERRVRGEPIPRDPVEVWKNADARTDHYESDRVPINGRSYEYPAGDRLIVIKGGEEIQVMDSCEKPWAEATVNSAFDSEPIRGLNSKYKIRVLERGAGLCLTGQRVIGRMIGRGSGEYHIIELNQKIAQFAREWKQRQEAYLRSASLDIQIYIHDGEATEVTKRLVEERQKFNIIISDTFPLVQGDEGINDIKDIDTLKRALFSKGEGVFAFFAYYPKKTRADLTWEQLRLLAPNFRGISVNQVEVFPAKDYSYLFQNGRPVRQLPVVICTDPIK